MSAIFNPSPVETPKGVAPTPFERASGAAPSRWKWWVALGAILLAGAVAYFVLRGSTQEPAAQSTVRTAKVLVGSFDRVLRVTGTTAARNFASITAPMMRGPDSGRNLVLIKLATPGTVIQKGALLAEIDAQPIKDHVDDLDALVTQANADIKKRQAEQAIEMETLRQTVREAKAAVDKAKLDNGAAEIRMPIDKELLQLGIQEADAQY